MLEEEQNNLWAWLADGAKNYLESYAPGLVNDAPMSTCIRLRWFNIAISGASYTLGINIHYGGKSGGIWLINEATRETLEAHPSANPRHKLNKFIEFMMPIHIKGWDQNKGTNFMDTLKNSKD